MAWTSKQGMMSCLVFVDWKCLIPCDSNIIRYDIFFSMLLSTWQRNNNSSRTYQTKKASADTTQQDVSFIRITKTRILHVLPMSQLGVFTALPVLLSQGIILSGSVYRASSITKVGCIRKKPCKLITLNCFFSDTCPAASLLQKLTLTPPNSVTYRAITSEPWPKLLP